MSLQTNGLVLMLRNIGRTLGVNTWIGARLNSEGYEARYDDAFLSEIRNNDIVWDVGANIGYYTRKFVEKIGENGSVVAFEPSPINFKTLESKCKDLQNVALNNFALGKEDGLLHFQQGEDQIGATSRIVENGTGGINVNVKSGADLIDSGDISLPNVIKIDVEGFELEVLEGMKDKLNDPKLRVIGCEIHFGILKQRGLANAPKLIEKMLNDAGFTVKWTDSSHLLAVRS